LGFEDKFRFVEKTMPGERVLSGMRRNGILLENANRKAGIGFM
jgi:hypothetical protein